MRPQSLRLGRAEGHLHRCAVLAIVEILPVQAVHAVDAQQLQNIPGSQGMDRLLLPVPGIQAGEHIHRLLSKGEAQRIGFIAQADAGQAALRGQGQPGDGAAVRLTHQTVCAAIQRPAGRRQAAKHPGADLQRKQLQRFIAPIHCGNQLPALLRQRPLGCIGPAVHHQGFALAVHPGIRGQGFQAAGINGVTDALNVKHGAGRLPG